MLSEENRNGLYVAIPIYFVVIGIVAYLSRRRLKYQEEHGLTDKLTGHYLGGRSFGPLVIAGTVFATQFSGYTVVGVPNESFRGGFQGYRWVATMTYLIFFFIGTGVRLRKASLVRNHSTPVDFITDRFRSQLLRYTVLLIQVLASIVYLAAQVNSLQSTFNSMFGYDPSDVWPVIIIMSIILAFEWAGGLAVVAMSDSIQGFVMVVSFLCLPVVILRNWGGWKDIDPMTFPRPDFYQTPSAEDQWDFWQFSFSSACFFALPHMMQRIYAAKDLSALKVGFAVQTVGPWLTMLAGVFIGTMGVVMLDQGGQDPNPASPFTAIIEEVMSLGGFPNVVGVIALTASLAAIMSTADSLIIAISQLVTVEVIWPLRPNASQRELAWFGRITSLFSVGIALITGILWKAGVSALAAINFPIAIQAIPPYLNGLYASRFKLHPWSLATGALVGTTYVFAFFFGYLYMNKTAAPVNAGVTGVLLNVVTCYTVEILFFDRSKLFRMKEVANDENEGEQSKRPGWDVPCGQRFGETPLTASLLNEMMTGFPEAMKSPSYHIFFFLSVSLITPLVAEGQPVFDAETGDFVSEPPIVNGIPWWFFKQILLSLIPYAALFKMIWSMPTEYPFDEDRIDKEGINPNILELTPQEMNVRPSFDAPNESVRRRRSTVSAKMGMLGMSVKSAQSEVWLDHAKLSCIIKQEEARAGKPEPAADDDVETARE